MITNMRDNPIRNKTFLQFAFDLLEVHTRLKNGGEYIDFPEFECFEGKRYTLSEKIKAKPEKYLHKQPKLAKVLKEIETEGN